MKENSYNSEILPFKSSFKRIYYVSAHFKKIIIIANNVFQIYLLKKCFPSGSENNCDIKKITTTRMDIVKTGLVRHSHQIDYAKNKIK